MFENVYLLLSSPEGASGSPGGAATFLPLIAIFAVFYFLMIRPQSQKAKNMKKMLANLTKGDKIITIGGIHGTVASVGEKTVHVKVDDNTKLEFSKESIATVVVSKASPDTSKDSAKTKATTEKIEKTEKN